jgi:hypothetical protein
MEHQRVIHWKSLTLLALILSALFVTVGVETAPAGATKNVSVGDLPDHDPHAALKPEDRWHRFHVTMESFDHDTYSCSGDPYGDATEGSCEGWSDEGTDPFPKDQQMMFRWDPYGQTSAHPRRLKITIRANNDYIYGVIDGPEDGSMVYATDGRTGDLPFSHFTSSGGQDLILQNPLLNEDESKQWRKVGTEGGPLEINVGRYINPFTGRKYELIVNGYLYW